MPDGSVLTDDGQLILEDVVTAPETVAIGGNRVICSSAIKEAIVLRATPVTRLLVNVPSRERVIPGTALLFGGNGNFGHLVNDYLSKLAPLTQLDQWDHIILSYACHNAAEDFLALLGIPAESIVRQAADERIRANRLFVPSLGHRFPDVPVSHTLWLRNKFRRPPEPLEPRKRLFVSRAGATGRNIQNSRALSLLLDAFGIQEVRFDQLTLEAQLNTLATCELIIGASGSGTGSFYFVPDDCAVIELYFPGSGPLSQRPGRIMSHLGHWYRSVECDRVAFRSLPGVDGDLSVPLNKLRSAIMGSFAR